MTAQSPRLTIGLPVYNGERYLVEALECLLSQDFTDFELIISDNASTDSTEQICRSFAERDRRIKYVRNPTNKGAIWNWNRVVQLAKGMYFKWAADDDLYSPSFTSRCVEVLDKEPAFVLSTTRTARIDENGNPIAVDLNYDLHVDSRSPHERFRYLTCINHSCFHLFGVIRKEILDQTNLLGNYVAADRVLIAHLALLGPFYEIPENAFFHRDHPRRHTRAVPSPHARTAWHDPVRGNRVRFVFPAWRLLGEYSLCALRAPLPIADKGLCMLQLLRWLRWNWRRLGLDLVLFSRFLLGIGPNPYIDSKSSLAKV